MYRVIFLHVVYQETERVKVKETKEQSTRNGVIL